MWLEKKTKDGTTIEIFLNVSELEPHMSQSVARLDLDM